MFPPFSPLSLGPDWVDVHGPTFLLFFGHAAESLWGCGHLGKCDAALLSIFSQK